MNKTSYILLLFILMKSQIFAQSPNWSVVESDFQYTMTMVAFSNINGIELSSENDKVAAFIGGECRGVTNLTYVESENSYFAYLTVFSNENNEDITFQVYDSNQNAVADIDKTLSFEINKHVGNVFTPYSVSDPELNSGSDILSLSLEGVAGVIDQDSKTITVDLNPTYNPQSVTIDYSLSSGAEAFIDEVALQNNTEGLDFSSEKEITIVPQDKSIAQTWSVRVTTNTGSAAFYRKNAICYLNGLIKVTFPTDETSVVLKKDNVVLKSQNIVNGETIFTELEAGVYLVEINGVQKEITIKLKV